MQAGATSYKNIFLFFVRGGGGGGVNIKEKKEREWEGEKKVKNDPDTCIQDLKTSIWYLVVKS